MFNQMGSRAVSGPSKNEVQSAVQSMKKGYEMTGNKNAPASLEASKGAAHYGLMVSEGLEFVMPGSSRVPAVFMSKIDTPKESPIYSLRLLFAGRPATVLHRRGLNAHFVRKLELLRSIGGSAA